MVDVGGLTQTVSTAGTSLASFAMTIGITMMVVALIGGIGFWLWRFMRHDWSCHVYDFDSSGNPYIHQYRGGVYVDGKTNHKRFWIMGMKGYSFNPDCIRAVLGKKGKRHAYFVRYGEKDIRPLNINLQPNPGISATIDDVDSNWFITEKVRWQNVLYPKNWQVILAWVGLFFVGIIFLVFMVMVLNKFEVLDSISQSMIQVSENLRQASSTSGVIK